MFEFIRLIFIGIIFGVANVIPGVSGGTIAVVFGVYDRLIQVITLNVKKIFSQWKFLLPFGLGIVIGIIIFSKLITVLFEKFPLQTNWFFIGIIIGSIPMVYNKMVFAEKKSQGAKKLPSISSVICCVVALGIMIFMTVTELSDSGIAAQTVFSASLAIKLFFGLMVASVAMIIPGISGSFIMLAFGIYSTVIASVAELNIPLLVPAALGAVVGLLGGAKLVRWLMEKIPCQTYGAIMGLVIGSVFVIFPGFGSVGAALVSVLCAILGFAVSFFASKNKEA